MKARAWRRGRFAVRRLHSRSSTWHEVLASLLGLGLVTYVVAVGGRSCPFVASAVSLVLLPIVVSPRRAVQRLHRRLQQLRPPDVDVPRSVAEPR